ncbi:MAG: 50S ribosomal protein L13 [bacterium]|nr:50S ribosomal protein L13 [bacterium]
MTKTTIANVETHAAAMNSWHVVDATDQTLGRMATEVATILMGKHRPDYTPNILVGEGVIITNATKIRMSGNKAVTRVYTKYTGYAGGLRSTTMGEYLENNPVELVTNAVRRMLPKNKLARRMIARLKVYPGAEHPHGAQKPQDLQVSDPNAQS